MRNEQGAATRQGQHLSSSLSWRRCTTTTRVLVVVAVLLWPTWLLSPCRVWAFSTLKRTTVKPSWTPSVTFDCTATTVVVAWKQTRPMRPTTGVVTRSLMRQGRQEQYNEASIFRLNAHQDWDGDDLRWLSKWRRRVRRRSNGGIVANGGGRPVRNTLLLLNTAAYIYQVVNTVQWIGRQFPQYWPAQAGAILVDVLAGSAATGPLTADFYFSVTQAARQPHRYLTAGFLHGSLLHLLVNMDALRRLPAWLEMGLGSNLFLTAFLVAVVTGNVGHAQLAGDARAACLGASGGICGLYGLMYAQLVQMGNSSAAGQVLRQMGSIVVAGFLLPNISNASHVAGFVGGAVVGGLLGPTYRRSYAATRKWSLAVDRHGRDYRAVLGFGVEPRQHPQRLVAAWIVTAAWLYIGNPAVRTSPQLIWKGLIRR